jgi:hypothetical protein
MSKQLPYLCRLSYVALDHLPTWSTPGSVFSFVLSDWSRVTYFANPLAYQTWPHKPLRMFLFVPTPFRLFCHVSLSSNNSMNLLWIFLQYSFPCISGLFHLKSGSHTQMPLYNVSYPAYRISNMTRPSSFGLI